MKIQKAIMNTVNQKETIITFGKNSIIKFNIKKVVFEVFANNKKKHSFDFNHVNDFICQRHATGTDFYQTNGTQKIEMI